MSDLISREKDIDVLKETGIIQDNDLGHLVVDEINRIPTAYDVEAVVEKLEENGQKMSEAKAIRPYAKHSPADHRYYKAISVKKAVDIVRSGGKEQALADKGV